MVSLALGAGGGLHLWASAEQREERALHAAARERVDAALSAAHDEARARAALSASSHAGGTVLADARSALEGAVAQGRATLDGSAGDVGDDAVRVELAARLDAAQAAAATASPTAARGLASAVAAAEQAVLAAVAAQEVRLAEEEAARAAASAAARRGSSGASAGSSSSGGGDRCATTYGGPAFYTSTPTEGGDGSNGRLAPSALSAVSWTRDSRGTPFYLRSDAAAALERLNAAFRAALGHDLALDLTYRDYDTQVAMRAALGSVAAVPGTSSHGTGLALDVPELPCDYGWDSAARAWLVANGPAYGWVSPAWARQNGSNPEYWHYEYRG
ncbi:M15 family metallopeptidase [Cellulomonas wangsupingiae]|uniref:M15 family metallopeptidase n=1 Tax=Cellulomonas wangsupingiae TaxID=2968085 RepID=A0ABY5K5T8_9CELL|nr:M15 family metallopeptidase [Cellulomonas wangsupingiae]MCC2336301.1 M15 family metallopeptidase [Cellulomonas wangsupingiae]UUI65720.1 M15 family metallopeptidase [Cellulomonas wangsupingiae]